MSKIIDAQGKYNVKDTGEEVSYNFSYTAIDNVADAVEELGEDKVKSLIQRQLKVDSNNIAREKAKSANGHSTRQPMSEEEKAEKKTQRQADKNLLAILKEKGLTASDIANL